MYLLCFIFKLHILSIVYNIVIFLTFIGFPFFFIGLAVAVDPTFKTFEAAYPYVVQKLLVDNSAATRRILHSVPYRLLFIITVIYLFIVLFSN